MACVRLNQPIRHAAVSRCTRWKPQVSNWEDSKTLLQPIGNQGVQQNHVRRMKAGEQSNMDGAVKTSQEVKTYDQRDELILEHLDYVRHLIDQLVGQLPETVDAENLESVGILGLVESANQYDPTRGASFTTFAYLRIRGAVLDELRRNCPLSQQMLSQITRIRKACEALPAPVTPEALAESTGLTVDEIEASFEAMRLTQPDSWNDPISSAFSRHDQGGPTPDDQAQVAETRQILTEAITQLPEKERVIVSLYYLEDLRLKEIGEILELSPSRISRLLSRAEFRLREYLRARGES